MSSAPDNRIPFLSVVIPAWNEESAIARTLAETRAYLSSLPFVSEIIVIDDGSRDATAARAREALEGFEHAHVRSFPHNHGKGWAVREGMLMARGTHRLFMDADHSTDIRHMDTFLPLLAEYDIVIGSRGIEGARLEPPQNLMKRTLGIMGNLFIQALLLRGISDTQCGFKCFRGNVADDIFHSMSERRWVFDVEALALARAYGFSVKEVPVRWVNDAHSKVRPFDYLKSFFDVVRVWQRIHRDFPRYRN